MELKIIQTMKIKNLLLLSLFAMLLFTFSSCEVEKPCETNSTGEITVRNSNSDPFDCYINSTFMGTISANSSRTFNVSSGSKFILVEQASGFILSVYQINTSISNCEEYTYNF